MRIEEEIKLDYSDVLFRPKRSTLKSRKDVDLNRKYTFKHSRSLWKGIPIIASNMDGVGEIDVAKKLSSHKLMTALTKQHDINQIGTIYKRNIFFDSIALSCGTSKDSYNRLNSILKKYPKFKFICIDVANGYSENFSNFVSEVRKKYPKKTIIAGNVVTADMTQELVLSGADIVKVGIGPGSVCTTRIQTGCADAAHGLGAHIIADGGCTCPGDVAKGFGAGADFVMLGGMLAGHKEGGGDIIEENGTKFIEFYGSSSEEANEKHYGGLANYRSSEGKKVKIQMKNSLDSTIRDILGGVRSSCTYVGASSLKQLSKCTTFVRVNNQYNDTFGKV